MFGKNLILKIVIKRIEKADDFEIREIMSAIEQRFAIAYPEWDVVYAAVHKDPTLRETDLETLTAYIRKDLAHNRP